MSPPTTEQLAAQKRAKTDKQKFVKLRPIGETPWCVCEPCEVSDMLEGADPAEYEQVEVWMTQADYEALKEFEGW
jgi:hypothetical protein